MKYVLAFLIVLFSSYADIFLFRVGIVPLTPSVSLIPLFLVVSLLRYSLLDLVDIFKSHSFKILAFILFLSLVYSAVSDASSEIIIEKISLNFISLMLYTFALHFFRTESKNLVSITLIMCLFVLGGSVLYDFFIGLPKHTTALEMSVRKGGFGENPNQAASGIKFVALAALAYMSDLKRLKLFVITFMCLSIFLTFSRSGLLSLVFILALGALNNWKYLFQNDISLIFQRLFKLTLLFTVLYFSLALLANIIRANYPQFTRGEAGKRLDLLVGQSETNNLQQEALEGGRVELLFTYLREFKTRPFGYGTGYTTDKRVNNGKLNTHNYYLYLAVNFGIIGLVMYMVYVIYNLRLALNHKLFYYFIFACLFLLEGFFTHNLFHERSIIICLALFDSQIYKGNYNILKTKQALNEE